jgi:2,3-bisphosphoglycerate-independent phosphoglycerate mutase
MPLQPSPKQGKSSHRRVILIVGDGMADHPQKQLGDKTPLEAAAPRNLDRVAANGISGLMDPVASGVAPGTEAANLSILGYDPQAACCGRGPFEAAGVGIALGAGDVAFRCNFATVDDGFRVVDERAGRIREEAAELAKALQALKLRENADVEVEFRQSLGFKGALVLRGEGLSPNVSAGMPKAGDIAGQIKPLDATAEAAKTANALNEFTHLSFKLLNEHPINQARKLQGKPPANVVVPWNGGKPPVLADFGKKYGLKASCVAAASVIKGIAKLTGMTVVEVSGATGELDTDTLAKAQAALQALRNSDFVWVHVEAADEASHDGDVQGKIGIIRKIDAMVGAILDHVSLEEVGVVLVSDHVTASELRMHTGDSVPIAVASSHVNRDGVKEYSERAAARGGLGRIQGKDVMPLIMNLLGRPEKIVG